MTRCSGFLAVFVAAVVFASGCAPDSRPETLEFGGRQFAGVSASNLHIGESDVEAIGTATSLAAGDISDRTVLQIRGIPATDVVVLRRNGGGWALFTSRPIEEVRSICAFIDPKPAWCQQSG